MRTEQAGRTRGRILDAAARIFESRGFAGTRIEDVAAAAGVAVPTVYKVFGSKRRLLVDAVHRAIADGDDGAAEEQAWFSEQIDEPNPARQLQLIARNARHMYERAGTLLNVLRAAAPLDDELAGAWDDIASQRAHRSRLTAKNLVAKAGKGGRLAQADVAATLLALTEPELFTSQRSLKRTADAYEAWLADVLCRTILR